MFFYLFWENKPGWKLRSKTRNTLSATQFSWFMNVITSFDMNFSICSHLRRTGCVGGGKKLKNDTIMRELATFYNLAWTTNATFLSDSLLLKPSVLLQWAKGSTVLPVSTLLQTDIRWAWCYLVCARNEKTCRRHQMLDKTSFFFNKVLTCCER